MKHATPYHEREAGKGFLKLITNRLDPSRSVQHVQGQQREGTVPSLMPQKGDGNFKSEQNSAKFIHHLCRIVSERACRVSLGLVGRQRTKFRKVHRGLQFSNKTFKKKEQANLSIRCISIALSHSHTPSRERTPVGSQFEVHMVSSPRPLRSPPVPLRQQNQGVRW